MGNRVVLPGRVESAEVGGIVAGADAIMDDSKGKVQSVINSETDAELLRLESEKQDNITVDTQPVENSGNPISSGAVYAADKALSDAIEAILLLIPSAASVLNKLADVNYVQSAVATATAAFKGTYNLVSDLHLSVSASHSQIAAALDALSLGADANDYCFVQVPTSDQSSVIEKTERYKFNGTSWAYEYDLNNSGFTSDQWAAINSNITALLVSKLIGLPTSEVLASLLASKQDRLEFDNMPTAGSDNPVKSGGIYTRNNEIIALINALDQSKQNNLTFDQSPVNGSTNPVTSGGVYQAVYMVQVTLAALDGRVASNEYSVGLLTERVGILNVLYQALSQNDIIVGALPATGVANVIYRVPGTSSFADWMYYNGAWVKLAEYTTLDGYLYKGIATPSSSPAASSVKMFYIALIVGTYTNYGGLVVQSVPSILKYDGANWSQDVINTGEGVFDISVYNAVDGVPKPYSGFGTAVTEANIPLGFRKGGMSVKFIQGTVQSVDNNYVQYRLMSTTWSTTDSDWQGVDVEPVPGSHNIVESGGVAKSELNSVINDTLCYRGYAFSYARLKYESNLNFKSSPMLPLAAINPDYVAEGLTVVGGDFASVTNTYPTVIFFDANKDYLSVLSFVTKSNYAATYIIQPNVIPANAKYVIFNTSASLDTPVLFDKFGVSGLRKGLGDIYKLEGCIRNSGAYNNSGSLVYEMYSTHIAIPVTSGQKLRIVTAETNNIYLFAKTYNRTTKAITISEATGFTIRITQLANSVSEYTIPSDVNYLIFIDKYSANASTLGLLQIGKITIDGYDIAENILGNMKDVCFEVNRLNSLGLWTGTQVEYDALGTYDPKTLYFITV